MVLILSDANCSNVVCASRRNSVFSGKTTTHIAHEQLTTTAAITVVPGSPAESQQQRVSTAAHVAAALGRWGMSCLVRDVFASSVVLTKCVDLCGARVL